MRKYFQKQDVKICKDSSTRYSTDISLTSPEVAAEYFESIFKLSEQAEENFCLIALDTKNKPLAAFMVSRGSVSSAIVHPREVYKRAISCNASAIIVAHNHPSGNTRPSKEDVEITKRLKEAGEIIGIPLLDHIILAVKRAVFYFLKMGKHQQSVE